MDERQQIPHTDTNHLFRTHLLQHAELTKHRADAMERYLRLIGQDAETIARNEIGNLDVFIDLAKNIFSVAFTGFVALRVANPEWVNSTGDVINFTLIIIVLAFVALLVLTRSRTFRVKKIADLSTARINSARALLDAEDGCIEGVIKMHTDFLSREPKN